MHIITQERIYKSLSTLEPQTMQINPCKLNAWKIYLWNTKNQNAKRKLGLVKRIQKQIDNFGLTNAELNITST